MATSALAAAKIAAARTLRWNTSVPLVVPPRATDTSSARPSAPPISREVSTAPPASPASSSSTPVNAAIWMATSRETEADADDRERREDVGQVGGVGRHAGEEQQAGALDGHADGESLRRADPGDDLWRHLRRDAQGQHGDRDGGRSGRERRVVEDLLGEQRRLVDQPEEARPQQPGGEVGEQQGPLAQRGQGDERRGDVRLDGDEGRRAARARRGAARASAPTASPSRCSRARRMSPR